MSHATPPEDGTCNSAETLGNLNTFTRLSSENLSLHDSIHESLRVNVGGDISEHMIEYANKKYKTDRCSFRVLDIASPSMWVNWPENTFDKIFSFFCVAWVKDLSQVAENMSYLLKSGGELVIFSTVWVPVSEMFLKIYSNSKWRKYMKVLKSIETIFYEFEHKKFSNYLKAEGFNVLMEEVKDANHQFSSVEKFIVFMESVNPFLARVPESMLEELKEECKNLVFAENGITVNVNNSVDLQFSTFRLHAIKIPKS